MKTNVDVTKAFVAIMSAALFSVAFALLASSCTESGTPEATPKNAKLQLAVTGSQMTPGSRSTGAALPTQENSIKTLAVGVFNADGSVNAIREVTLDAGSLTTPDLDCSPGICDVVVVANAPQNTFSGVQTKAEFFGKTVDLSKTAAADVQTSTNLPMSGQNEKVEIKANEINATTVALTRLVARISIESIKTKFAVGTETADATFKLDKVFLFNALGNSCVAVGDDIASTFPTTPQWMAGGRAVLNTSSNMYEWVPGEKYLLNEITPVTLSGEGTGAYNIPNWFYAFANNSATNPTKLVIAGYYDPDGDGTAHQPVYVYYPITVNQAQMGTEFDDKQTAGHDGTIKRNVAYRLKATIAKKGVQTPEDELGTAALQLTVSVADWKLEIIQDVVIE